MVFKITYFLSLFLLLFIRRMGRREGEKERNRKREKENVNADQELFLFCKDEKNKNCILLKRYRNGREGEGDNC